MNNKVKNVIIIILAVLVLGLGGYLVYEKMLSNDNGEGLENNQEIKEENYDLSKAKELIDDYYYLEVNGSTFTKGYTDEVKMYLSTLNVERKNVSKYSCDYFYKDNEFSYEVYRINLESGLVRFCNKAQGTQVISYENLSNTYKELFGNESTLPKKDFSFSLASYDYNSENNLFIELSCNCGGIPSYPADIYGVKSAKIINDKLIIDVGRVEVSWNDNFEGTVVIDVLGQKFDYNLSEVNSEDFKQQFLSQYLDKLDTYKFTFFEEDGIYKLESMVKE